MDWNKFLMPTMKKFKLTIILILFYFIMTYLVGRTFSLLSPYLNESIEASVESLSKQPVFLILSLLVSLLNFLILAIVSYLFACIILNLFEKKKK